MKLRRAAGPDDLPPVLFKTGSVTLVRVVTQLFESIWHSESVPESWGESTVIPIFKNGRKTVWENHRDISLTPVITKLLASIILHRLTPARENQIREQQAGFRPGRGCIDHIFTLRQHLEHRNIFCRPTIAVFLDLKAAFDSVNRETLFDLMLRQGVPPKYVSIMKALYSHTTGRVRAYGQLSECFKTVVSVKDVLSPPFSSTANLPNAQDETLFDLEYADDIVYTFETFTNAQSLLKSLICSADRYGLKFAPAKCKTMLFNWTKPVCPLFMEGKELEQVEMFTYLGSCISTNGNITSEITARISKAQAAFFELTPLITLYVRLSSYQGPSV